MDNKNDAILPDSSILMGEHKGKTYYGHWGNDYDPVKGSYISEGESFYYRTDVDDKNANGKLKSNTNSSNDTATTFSGFYYTTTTEQQPIPMKIQDKFYLNIPSPSTSNNKKKNSGAVKEITGKGENKHGKYDIVKKSVNNDESNKLILERKYYSATPPVEEENSTNGTDNTNNDNKRKRAEDGTTNSPKKKLAASSSGQKKKKRSPEKVEEDHLLIICHVIKNDLRVTEAQEKVGGRRSTDKWWDNTGERFKVLRNLVKEEPEKVKAFFAIKDKRTRRTAEQLEIGSVLYYYYLVNGWEKKDAWEIIGGMIKSMSYRVSDRAVKKVALMWKTQKDIIEPQAQDEKKPDEKKQSDMDMLNEDEPWKEI